MVSIDKKKSLKAFGLINICKQIHECAFNKKIFSFYKVQKSSALGEMCIHSPL